jgi:hypothetical protein
MKSSNQSLEPIGGKGRPPLSQFFDIPEGKDVVDS